LPRKTRRKASHVRRRNAASRGFVWRLAIRDPIEVYDDYIDDVVLLKFGQDDPASIEGLVIDFRYYSRDGETTRRSILCQQCGRVGERIYIRGYCPFREELRTFRVDRMSEVIAIMSDRDLPVEDAAAFFAAYAADETEEDNKPSLAASDG